MKYLLLILVFTSSLLARDMVESDGASGITTSKEDLIAKDNSLFNERDLAFTPRQAYRFSIVLSDHTEAVVVYPCDEGPNPDDSDLDFLKDGRDMKDGLFRVIVTTETVHVWDRTGEMEGFKGYQNRGCTQQKRDLLKERSGPDFILKTLEPPDEGGRNEPSR